MHHFLEWWFKYEQICFIFVLYSTDSQRYIFIYVAVLWHETTQFDKVYKELDRTHCTFHATSGSWFLTQPQYLQHHFKTPGIQCTMNIYLHRFLGCNSKPTDGINWMWDIENTMQMCRGLIFGIEMTIGGNIISKDVSKSGSYMYCL